MNLWKNLKIALAAVAILWIVYLLNLTIAYDLRMLGLRPRNLNGLMGILIAPFLHLDIRHLIANSGAFFFLIVISMSFSHKLTVKAISIIILVGGGLVWLFGSSDSIHIGASGIIFGLIGFLMFLGFFRREWIALVFSALIFVLYGGAVSSLLIYAPGVSWSGHIFGFLSGILAAWWTKIEKK